MPVGSGPLKHLIYFFTGSKNWGKKYLNDFLKAPYVHANSTYGAQTSALLWLQVYDVVPSWKAETVTEELVFKRIEA